MAESPKDIYSARERDRTVVEEPESSPGQDRWIRDTTRGRWSTAILTIIFMLFIALLTAVILYQQKTIRTVRETGIITDPGPLHFKDRPERQVLLDVDPAGHVILDEVLDLAPRELPAEGSVRLTAHWVAQTAFHLRTADRAYAEGNWAAALEQYRQALRIIPDIEGIPERMGLCHLRIEEFPEAERRFEAALQRQTNSAPLLNNQGVSRMGQKQYEKAEGDFRKAMAVDPEYAPARHNLGLLYFRTEQMQKAAEVFAQGLRAEPTNTDTAHMYAVALMRLNRWEEAAALLDESARTNPTAAPILFRLAEARSRIKNFDGAMVALRDGIARVDVRTALLWVNRKEFDLLRGRSDFQQTVLDLTKAIP